MPSHHRQRIFVASCCLAVLAAALALPGYRYINHYRAAHHARAATALMAAGDFTAAWEKAYTAYHLAPNHVNSCRVMARWYELVDSSSAATFWNKAYAASGDLLDLKQAVKCSLLAGEVTGLEAAFTCLTTALPNDAEVLFLRADWLLRNHQFDPALAMAQRVIRLPDAPDQAHFFYVQLSQFSEDLTVRDNGIVYLRELAQRDDTLGLESLRNLAKYDRNTTDQAQAIVFRMQAHPLAQRKDLLVALQALANLPQTDIEQVIAQAQSHFDLNNLNDLIILGRWLNRTNLHAATLDTVSLAQARQRQDLLLVRLDAMAGLNRWDAIGQALEDHNIPLDTYLRLLFEARVNLETGFPDKADIAWNRAQLAAAHDPKKLWLLADYAKNLNLLKEARSALERLTEIPSSMRQAYEALILLELKQGETRRLRDTFAKMVEVYPSDVAVMNDLAYTNLLLNENIAAASARAQGLVAMHPTYLANRITLALAYLRSNKSAHALQVLQAVPVNWEQVKVGWRAVYAAILRDSGLDAEAETVLANMNLSLLLPEEKQLLSQS